MMSDAPLMLEWMHDKTVVEHMATDFASMTLANCENFINNSMSDDKNLNLAVVGEDNRYLGTVSLKHINNDKKTAEFAITMRASAMGTGASVSGMSDVIRYGFEQLKLEEIYWCVSKKNERAIKFYNKRYSLTKEVPSHIANNYTKEQLDDFLWYSISKNM